jgi:hypothetical protein
MPNDYRMTFADQADWLVVADSQGWIQREYAPQEDPEAEPVVVSTWIASPGLDFVVLGTIYEPQAPVPEDVEPPPPVPYPGYGVNIRYNVGIIAEDLVQYVVYPQDPYNSFAGGWYPGALPVMPQA